MMSKDSWADDNAPSNLILFDCSTGEGHCAQPKTLSPDQQEHSRILFSLDPMGGISLGKDGILRFLTADRDYRCCDTAAPPD